MKSSKTQYLKIHLLAIFICLFSVTLVKGQSTRFYPVKTDVYTISLNGKNLSIDGEAKAEANVLLQATADNAKQQFRFIEQLRNGNSTNFFLIQSVANPKMYVTIHYSRLTEGTNIKLNPRKHSNQLWTFKNGAIETALSINKYIGTIGDNNLVIVNNGPSFTYTKVSGSNSGETTSTYNDYFKTNNLNTSESYIITAKHSNKSIEFPFISNFSQAIQNTTNQSEKQQFKIIDEGKGIYMLKNVNSNKFMESRSNKVHLISSNTGNGVLFKLVDMGKGYCSIVTYGTGKAIDVPRSSKADGKGLIFYSKTGNPNQLFKFDKISNVNTPTPIDTPTNNTGGTITFKNPKPSFVVEISKLNDDSFSKSLGPLQSVSIPAKVGDIYTFSLGDADGFSALPYTVKNIGVTHIIQIGERYTSGKGEKLPNTKASRYSYDIKKVDPIYIDYLGSQAIKDSKNKTIGYGGMRKEIFAPLKNTDIDWYNDDSDYALKNHFTFQNIMESKSSTETKMFYSAAAYQESFSGNIGADTPKGGGSATVSHTSSESDNETNIYTYSRTDVKAYSVSLIKNKIALTDEFKKAVMKLPKSNNSTAYLNFIKIWGTHYSSRTFYGGVQIAAYKFNAKEMMQSESLAVGIQGNVKAASAGGGYSKDETFNQKQSNAKGVYHSKGGTGTGENFAVDFDTSIPVGIDLIRLHNLLTSDIFKDGTPNTELSVRKAHLKTAITAYIGSSVDNGKSLKPRMYKISNVKWKATKGESDFNVYGNVWIAMMEKKNGDDSKLSLKNVWGRSDASGARVVARTNHTEKGSGEILYTVLPKNGAIQLNNYYLRVSSHLYDWNKSSSNENGGYKETKIDLNNVSTVPKTIFHDVNFPREETKIRVTATVQEINLGFDQ